jgi:hypothetical protein
MSLLQEAEACCACTLPNSLLAFLGNASRTQFEEGTRFVASSIPTWMGVGACRDDAFEIAPTARYTQTARHSALRTPGFGAAGIVSEGTQAHALMHLDELAPLSTLTIRARKSATIVFKKHLALRDEARQMQ